MGRASPFVSCGIHTGCVSASNRAHALAVFRLASKASSTSPPVSNRRCSPPIHTLRDRSRRSRSDMFEIQRAPCASTLRSPISVSPMLNICATCFLRTPRPYCRRTA
jgi:hypothetical protein